MFGMLDYRAHKLYFILFFIPRAVLVLFHMFCLPLIHYSIGLSLADERLFQILISLVALFIIEVIWLLILFGFISKVFEFIFSLFVDIIPHDGRTKEEAKMVVWNGEKGIRALAISKHPTTWTSELIDEIPKNDWVQNLFFKNELTVRLEAIFEHFSLLPSDSPDTDLQIDKILKEKNLEPDWQEKVFTNVSWRRGIVSYSFFILLIIFNPGG
jgi:hypothetical protein